MFQGKRMITRGVADTIPPEVQMFLWSLLDELVAKMAEEPDYLQVFEFSGENGNQTNYSSAGKSAVSGDISI